MKMWNIEEITGYKPITTIYEDFGIAEKFGANAIKDTYKRLFKEYKADYKVLTEFVMALNWKIYEHYETNRNYAQIYNELWEQLDIFAQDNLKGAELEYFYCTTD